MSDIRGLMKFTDAELLGVELNRQENKRLKAVCSFKTGLAQSVAETMRLKGVYKPDGGLEEVEETRSLGHVLVNCSLTIPSGDTQEDTLREFHPEVIKGFKLTHKDGKLSLQFVAHITGDPQVYDMIAIRKRFLSKEASFELAIRSAQGEFDFSGSNPDGTRSGGDDDDRDEDGTGEAEANGPLFNADNDPEGADAESGHGARCAFCDRGDPVSEDGFHMLASGPRRCGKVTDITDMSNAEPVPDEPQRGPALVDSRDMGHRRNKRQLTRGDVAARERGEDDEPVIPIEDEPTEAVQ